MNITFLVPIKSSKFVQNKQKFQRLIEKTVESTKKIDDSSTIIVCNDDTIPQLVPHQLVIPETYMAYGDDDKEYKVYLGCKYWIEKNLSTHLMILDCDDLVLPDLSSLQLELDENLVMMAGYQKIFFNRLFLLKNKYKFYYRAGSSLIFSKNYIKKQLPLYKREAGRWMFHQGHNLTEFTESNTPYVIHVPWNGENVWWTKPRWKDYVKLLFSKRNPY